MGETALRTFLDHGVRFAISLGQFPRIIVQADNLRRRILQIGIERQGATQRGPVRDIIPVAPIPYSSS